MVRLGEAIDASRDRPGHRSRPRRRHAAGRPGDRDGLSSRTASSDRRPEAARPAPCGSGPTGAASSSAPSARCTSTSGSRRLDGDILEQTPPRVGHRARTGRDPRHGARDDRRTARKCARTCPSGASRVGIPGPVDFAIGPPGRTADHARLERVRRPPSLRAALRRARLGRQRRQPARLQRARASPRRAPRPDLLQGRLRHRRRAALSQGRIHRGANGAAGDIGHVRVAAPKPRAAAARSAASRRSPADGRCARRRRGRRRGRGRRAGAHVDEARRSRRRRSRSRPRRRRPGDLAGPAVGAARGRVDRGARQHVQSRRYRHRRRGVVGAGEVFLAEVRQRVYELSLPLATRDLSIVRSHGDEKEPLRGGAEMVREQLFDATFPRWFADGRPTIARRDARGILIT